MFRSILFASVGSGWAQLFLEATPDLAQADVQHVWIVRHGDKYSSYHDCVPEEQGPCHNRTLMGDNAWLTPCGVTQANMRAQLLADIAPDIKQIVSSPWARALQTALPLAKSLNLKIKVDNFLSEARQPDVANFAFNALADEVTKGQLAEVQDLWDLDYGSFPLQTPEDDSLYLDRVMLAATQLKKRFPPSSGNLAWFTHATTSFSIVYGLCYGEHDSDEMLKQFVSGQDAIGPTGVIHVVRDMHGQCLSISQTDNRAMEKADCGNTTRFRCNFDDFPSWYWPSSLGKGPARCH